MTVSWSARMREEKPTMSAVRMAASLIFIGASGRHQTKSHPLEDEIGEGLHARRGVLERGRIEGTSAFLDFEWPPLAPHAGGPFPDVARHIQAAVGAGPAGKEIDRSGAPQSSL